MAIIGIPTNMTQREMSFSRILVLPTRALTLLIVESMDAMTEN